MTYRIQREPAPLTVLALDEECFPHDARVSLDGSVWPMQGFASAKRVTMRVWDSSAV
jgi:hypothetical protein